MFDGGRYTKYTGHIDRDQETLYPVSIRKY